MLEPARIPLPKVRKSIATWAAICCAIYIVFLFIMKFAGLMEVTGLRVVNYLVLFLVSFFGIKKWVSQTEHFVPFLTVFLTTLFTGIFSFALFCIFLIIYGGFDPNLTDLFHKVAPDTLKGVPSAIILFEGSAVSIIVAFINMQYFRRYEEGEVSPEKKHSVDKP
jgi:hypothetical protein